MKCFVCFIARKIAVSKESIYSLAIDSSASMIVNGSTANILQVWDPRTGFQIMKLVGHTENIRALAISPDRSHIVSGSSDGTIKVWNVGQRQCVQTMTVHSEGKSAKYSKKSLFLSWIFCLCIYRCLGFVTQQ